MASMAMAGTIGKNLANNMNDMMNGSSTSANTVGMQASVTPPPVAPPPVPEVKYHIAVGKQATGPFTIAEISVMAQEMKINGKTLVWKPGMAQWAPLETVEELKQVQEFIPPSFE